MTQPEALLAAQAEHFAATDPLLPDPVIPPGGEPIGALSHDRRPLLGVLREQPHLEGMASSLWSARVTQQLFPLVASGADVEPLLERWHTLLEDRRDPGQDSACVLTWPSRDTTAAEALLRHGFLPLTVLGVRTDALAEPADHAPVTVREADATDLPVLGELAMAELRFAARVGSGVVRTDAEELKATALRSWLDCGWPILLAELDGAPVGMVQCRASLLDEDSRPRLLPDGYWGYISCLSVHERARGRGVGRALMAEAHARLGVNRRGDYLYYNPANPLSSVFWPRQGYRPLWTVWELRPVKALR